MVVILQYCAKISGTQHVLLQQCCNHRYFQYLSLSLFEYNKKYRKYAHSITWNVVLWFSSSSPISVSGHHWICCFSSILITNLSRGGSYHSPSRPHLGRAYWGGATQSISSDPLHWIHLAGDLVSVCLTGAFWILMLWPCLPHFGWVLRSPS